jgi:hypothetical protein
MRNPSHLTSAAHPSPPGELPLLASMGARRGRHHGGQATTGPPLTDSDISQADGAIRNFSADIGTVGAHTCVYRAVTGINAARDHLLLTPNFNTTSSFLTDGIEYEDAREQADIKVCNPTGLAINDGVTRFNLLVINGVGNS